MTTTPRPVALRIAQRLTDYRDPASLGSRLRARRSGPLVDLIVTAHRLYGAVSVLDVGGTRAYWNVLPPGLLERHAVRVTLLNLTRGPDDSDDHIFTHVEGDGCDLAAYADGEFHVVHSNSVIEHVGGWARMKRFAQEVRRVGRGVFVQTPYFWFPVEPHYMTPLFHWLPRPVQVSLRLRFTLGHHERARDVDDAVTRNEGAPMLLDQREFRTLFPDCRLVKERVGFLAKSLTAVRDV